MKQEKGKKKKQERKAPFSFDKCLRLGLVANVMFLIFIVLCLIYYYLFGNSGVLHGLFDAVAFTVEFAGFFLMGLTIVGLCMTIRQRRVMKTLMSVYVVAETVLMLLDFGFIDLSFYNGQSVPLIVAHAICSALVGMTYLQLEPKRVSLQICVCIMEGLILSGMLSAVFHLRVYGSIFMNAVAHVFLFAALRYLLRQEELEVDCYGDRAKVTTYKSTFFE